MVTKRQTAAEKAKTNEKVDLLGRLEVRYGAPRRGRGEEGKLLAFIRYEDDIRKALESGYTVKQVWLSMHEDGLTTASYNTFAGHVRTRLGMSFGRPLQVAVSVPAEEPELDPEVSQGRVIDKRAYGVVIPIPEGGIPEDPKPRGGKKAAEKTSDPHAGIKFGAGAGQKPFDPSGG